MAVAKKLWVINHYGGLPDTVRSERTWRVSSALGKAGFDVDLFSASWHHLLGQESRHEGEERREKRDDFTFHAIPTRGYEGNGLARLRNMVDFTRELKRYAIGLEQSMRPDVIVASSPHPFVFKFALWAKRRFGCKIVLEERDLWPLSLVQLAGLNRWHPLSLLFERNVRAGYRNCDALVSLLEFSEPYLRSRGLPEGKFRYIPNGAKLSNGDTSKQPNSANLPRELEREVKAKKAMGKMIVVYTGAMGPPNALLKLMGISDLEKSGERLPFHLFLVGDGTERAKLEEEIRKREIGCISVYGPILKSEAKALVEKADVCLLSLLPAPLFEFGISPNKLFDYFESSKPVVFLGGGKANPVELSGGGEVIDDVRGLADALARFAEMGNDGRENIGLKGRHYLLENHDWEKLGERYVDVCESCVCGT